ncbi:MAG: zinc ribbon domain-containing protein [Oscillospiraceae bacterium]|nr:zinc ribbon domain-containing protein [Oscillospiraceae bacterium]
MRKGIIRIVIGVVLIILEVLSLFNADFASIFGYKRLDLLIGSMLGYFSPAIVGIILWRSGARAFNRDKYSEDSYFEQEEAPRINTDPVPESGWRCVCGRPHPRYESSCVCGKSKFDNINQPKAEETEVVLDKICFCRKCGEKLVDNSRFCVKCGAEIIKE